MNLLANSMNDGAAIVLTFVALIVTILLGVLFYFLIRRNILKDKEASEVIVENALTKNQITDSITNYIKKVDRFGAFSLLYIDIDGFADLNDVFGRETCDQMLKEAASRILRVLPYKASLARYQNDEFLVFIKDEDNKARLEKIATQINEIINNPYQVLIGESIRLSASIGVVTYPIAGSSFDELYNNLLLTTYVSKRDGGGRFTSYYSSISEEETSNMEYFQEVKGAIQRNEFTLYYQPIVNLTDGSLNGCECLMRWNHPEKGVQSPATFLKVLEQSGDIAWVGRWGLEEMIKIHNDMASKFQEIKLRFSLNLSTKQLLDPELANSFISIINKAQAKPEDYMLEVSDFMMLEKIAVVKTNIYKLKDFGFKIAVDGFELDGQSVQAIQRSPIDVIKLGRSFLKDIENNFMKERLLEILVKFASDNNKTIISEGVENVEVAKYVKDQNVFLEQGYLFGKPMSYEGFNEYVEKHQYRVVIEDITNLEDTERIMTMVGDNKNDDTKEEAYEENPEDLLESAVESSKENPEVLKDQYGNTPDITEEDSDSIDDLLDDLNETE